MVERNIWASPVLFVACSFFLFLSDKPHIERYGWYLYLAAWILPLMMLARCAVLRRGPGMSGAVGFTALAVGAVMYGFGHSASFPL